MAHLEKEECFQDKVECGWEDSLEIEQEPLVPDSIECLFDVEKDRMADLLQFKGGGYSVNHSITLLDGGMERAKTELVFGDFVGFFLLWDHEYNSKFPGCREVGNSKDRVKYVCQEYDTFGGKVLEDSWSYEVKAWSLLLREVLVYVFHILRLFRGGRYETAVTVGFSTSAIRSARLARLLRSS